MATERLGKRDMSQRNERKLWKLQYSGRLRASFAFLCVLTGIHPWNMFIFSKTQVWFRAWSESDYHTSGVTKVFPLLGLTVSREMHSGNMAMINDCLFWIIHNCWHVWSVSSCKLPQWSEHISSSAHSNQSAAVPIQTSWQCLQICCAEMIPKHFVSVWTIAQAKLFSISVHPWLMSFRCSVD